MRKMKKIILAHIAGNQIVEIRKKKENKLYW